MHIIPCGCRCATVAQPYGFLSLQYEQAGMGQSDNNALPAVPDGGRDSGILASVDWDRVIPDRSYPVRLPSEIDPGRFVKSPAVIPEVVAKYAVYGEKGVEEIAQRLRTQSKEKEGGKFGKGSVHYQPQSPFPPGVWEYKCETCRYYQPPGESAGTGPKCEMVGHEDNLFGGENVHPNGWCALWLPEEDEQWFDYIADRLEGEG